MFLQIANLINCQGKVEYQLWTQADAIIFAGVIVFLGLMQFVWTYWLTGMVGTIAINGWLFCLTIVLGMTSFGVDWLCSTVVPRRWIEKIPAPADHLPHVGASNGKLNQVCDQLTEKVFYTKDESVAGE